jgi:hypothetical protein
MSKFLTSAFIVPASIVPAFMFPLMFNKVPSNVKLASPLIRPDVPVAVSR